MCLITKDEPTRPFGPPFQHSEGWSPAACFSFSSFSTGLSSAGVNINHPIRPDGHLSYLGKVNHLAAPPPFFFARPLSTLCSSPGGEHLLDDRVIWHVDVLQLAFLIDRLTVDRGSFGFDLSPPTAASGVLFEEVVTGHG